MEVKALYGSYIVPIVKEEARLSSSLAVRWVSGWVGLWCDWMVNAQWNADWDKHWMVRLSCSTVYVSGLGRMFFGERHQAFPAEWWTLRFTLCLSWVAWYVRQQATRWLPPHAAAYGTYLSWGQKREFSTYPPPIIPFIHRCSKPSTPTVSINRIAALYCHCRWKYKWSED